MTWKPWAGLTRDELLARIAYLESCQRFYLAAEGYQWFHESKQREANQRELDAARKALAEMDTRK